MGQSGAKPTRNSPFMLGVSGHRDLDPADLPRLRETVAGFVRQLREFLPNTDIHLTVGMAAGADLLVAQTALDLGVQVEAVLPRAATGAEPAGRLSDAVREFERGRIEAALAAEGGNVTRAAARLGIERSHLYKKLRKLGG